MNTSDHLPARLLGRLWQALFPRRCAVCGTILGEGEDCICLNCNLILPRTGYQSWADNPLVLRLCGRFPLKRATAYIFYRKRDVDRTLLFRLKYGGRRDLGVALGRQMAVELSASGFFEGVDVLVPVPLHPRRQRQRGYNQSEALVQGIAAVTGIAVDTISLVRRRNTPTQTKLSYAERLSNVEGSFRLLRPEALRGKHVLLVDDVITTTATVSACADVLGEAGDIGISVLALAVAD